MSGLPVDGQEGKLMKKAKESPFMIVGEFP